MNELETAKAIATGQIPSPQVLGNMVLFGLRITGTGAAWREKWNEYVYRNPGNYLNADFLERCAGLPVIFNHPEGDILTSDNFKQHIIGTIIYAYVQDNEVWGIARINDTDAALSIIDDNLSTSPTFILSKDNQKRITLDDMTVLIEGKPELLDHIAICKEGVWNKGDENNNGILINNEDLMMEGQTPDLEQPAADAELPAQPAQTEPAAVAADGAKFSNEDIELITKLISDQLTLTESQQQQLNTLKQSLESATGDLTAKVDAQAAGGADLTSRLCAIEDKMKEPQELTDGDKEEVADAEQEAQKVAQAFGDSAKPAMRGEQPDAFKRRIAKAYQKNSQVYANVNLDAVNDKTALNIAFNQICADSVAAAAVMPRNNGRGAWVTETRGGRTIERVMGMSDDAAFSEFRIKPRVGHLIQRGSLQ